VREGPPPQALEPPTPSGCKLSALPAACSPWWSYWPGPVANQACIQTHRLDNCCRTPPHTNTHTVTIHQPSIEIFEAFDSLLLLQRGGRTTYFGPLGEHSRTLADYLMRVPGEAGAGQRTGLKSARTSLQPCAAALAALVAVCVGRGLGLSHCLAGRPSAPPDGALAPRRHRVPVPQCQPCDLDARGHRRLHVRGAGGRGVKAFPLRIGRSQTRPVVTQNNSDGHMLECRP
jgi:hypothetical protein